MSENLVADVKSDKGTSLAEIWRNLGPAQPWVAIALSILAAFAAGGLLFMTTGVDVLDAYATMLSGAVGSGFALTQTLVRTVPLLIIALGLAVVFRANVWNIGAEGQFLAGALLGGMIAIEMPATSPWIAVPTALLAGIIGGGLWGGIVGVLKARWGVHEVITSLLLNFIAAIGFSYAVRGPLRDPMGFLPSSEDIPSHAQLPAVPGLGVHGGLVLALLLVPLVAYLLYQMPFGIKVRMMGSSPSVTKASGHNPNKLLVLLMILTGAFAGLAGVVQVLGVQFNLQDGLSPGFGFTAILVALLGRLNPFGVLLAATVIAGISVGGTALQIEHGVPSAVVGTIGAFLVIFLLVSDRVATLGKR